MLIILPLKSTKKIDIETPLRLWTDSSHVEYTADDISSDLKRMNALRSDISKCISSPTSHSYSCKNNALSDLIQYHACLMECLNHGFPGEARDADVNGLLDAGLHFEWSSAFQAYDYDTDNHDVQLSPKSVCHLNYERVCVLWNIAALMTYQAASEQTWSTKESRTNVIQLYQTAARILRYIQYIVKDLNIKEGEWTLDLSHDSLEMCQQICLVQGQICAYIALKEKIHSQAPSSTFTLLSKIAAGVAMHADLGLLASQSLSIKNTRGSVVLGGHLKLVSILFQSRSEFLVAQVEKQSGKYGIEIARLERTVQMAKEGMEFLKSKTFVQAGKEGPSMLGSLPSSIESLLSNAKSRLIHISEENSRVYFEKVPDIAAMEKIIPKDVMEYEMKDNSELPVELTPISLERPMFVFYNRSNT